MFEDNFSNPGVSISTFSDVELGLNAIQTHPPDLIFVDYRLVNTTGDLVAARMDPSIPKALISGDLSIKEMSAFLNIFPKPFKFDEMEEFIMSFVERKLKTTQLNTRSGS